MNNPPPAPLLKPANPQHTLMSTALIIGGCVMACILVPGSTPLAAFRFCAVFGAVFIGAALALESMGGLRSIIRIDIAAFVAIYALTFGEFLVPNVRILYSTSPEGAVNACRAVMLGIACLAIGRHFPLPRRRRSKGDANLPPLSDKAIFNTLILFTFLGFFYVFLSVNFNPVKFFESLQGPRWGRPWGRGALGDWRSAFTELQMLLFVVAALGGYVLAKPASFSPFKRGAVVCILAFLFMFDFCEGTRTFFLIRISLFLAALLIASDGRRMMKPIAVSILTTVAILPLSGMMLQFRNVGLSAYLNGLSEGGTGEQGGFMIDNNMFSIARVMDIFPSVYHFPGFEILWISLIKPIPRFLWPGKPEGWSMTIEDALGAKGYTIAVTYIGEAYLVAGVAAIIVCSLALGSLGATWTRIGLKARTNMDLVFYASGFFAALVGMRSMQWITIALVPTLAFYLFGKVMLRRRRGVGRPRQGSAARLDVPAISRRAGHPIEVSVPPNH